jgi:hypothetical protein
MSIYINHLPKDKLLFELWKNARDSPYFIFCKDTLPTLTHDQVKLDISEMIKNNRHINLTTYYGRSLYIDITGDFIDTSEYEAYNRISEEKIISIINKLKIEELRNVILKFYIFW